MSNLAQLLQAPGASVEAVKDFDAINAMMRDKGWSDGLPIVPPTAAHTVSVHVVTSTLPADLLCSPSGT